MDNIIELLFIYSRVSTHKIKNKNIDDKKADNNDEQTLKGRPTKSECQRASHKRRNKPHCTPTNIH